jgi:hypothetical protein
MDWDPALVFSAAVRLSLAPFADNFYWRWHPAHNQYAGLDEAGRHKRQREELEHHLRSHPMQPPGVLGALWTTGGLAIHTYRARLHWIETSWGEWPCWDMPWSGIGRYGPEDTLARFLGTLVIDGGL